MNLILPYGHKNAFIGSYPYGKQRVAARLLCVNAMVHTQISSPLLLSTSRSSAMSSSTSALPPLSKYGNELLAEKQSYAGPADAVLNVKAAAFVPASAPTTPLMGSVESLDEVCGAVSGMLARNG